MAADEDEITIAIATAMRLNARRWDDAIPSLAECDRMTALLRSLRDRVHGRDRRALDDVIARTAGIREEILRQQAAANEPPPEAAW